VSSVKLANAIRTADFSSCGVTVVGYGHMGRAYVEALRALGVGRIHVCSRSEKALDDLGRDPVVETTSGGIDRLIRLPDASDLVIVATPTDTLVPFSKQLIGLGFRRLLIEKPVSLRSSEIEELAEFVSASGAIGTCAYNRTAYPSVIEAMARCSSEGGITSIAYDFTELIRDDWTERFPREELNRWGLANSVHVISMAHGLGGLPAQWGGYQTGGLEWHPNGSVFVGSGLTDKGIPFSYHADWDSKARWSVEAHTAQSTYRLCPLEQISRKLSGLGDYEEVSIDVFAPDLKAGVAEQVAGMLKEKVGAMIPMFSLEAAVKLTRYGEDVFGYAAVVG
jgi:predicted dehydrogenase